MTSPTYVPVVQNGIPLTPSSVTMSGAAADDLLTVRVTGDVEPQAVLNANGRLEFGGGATPPDVSLFRDGSTRLHTTNTFVTEGDLIVDVAGKGLQVKEGSNARMGAAVLVAGTATVANTSVTANTRIFLTSQVDGGTPGFVRVSTRSAGVSFTITSSIADTSTIAWLLIEPA